MEDMNLRALLVIGGLGLATFASAGAKDKQPTPIITNPNVKRSAKKAPKFKPRTYKAPKRTAKPPAARRGVKPV